MLCLNPTLQHHIAISFAKHVVAALNGEAVNWPQEFYHEITEKMAALHAKHHATKVKVGKTSIGPHMTLIVKAAGTFDIREEFKASYGTLKALTIMEQIAPPKRTKAKAVKGAGSQPKTRVLTL